MRIQARDGVAFLLACAFLIAYFAEPIRDVERWRAKRFWKELVPGPVRRALPSGVELAPLDVRKAHAGGVLPDASSPLAVLAPGCEFWVNLDALVSTECVLDLSLRASIEAQRSIPVVLSLDGTRLGTVTVSGGQLTPVIVPIPMRNGEHSRVKRLGIGIAPGVLRSPWDEVDETWLDRKAERRLTVTAWPGVRAEIMIGDERHVRETPGLLVERADGVYILAWVPGRSDASFPKAVEDEYGLQCGDHVLPGQAFVAIAPPGGPLTRWPLDHATDRAVRAEVLPGARFVHSGVWIGNLAVREP